MKNKIIYLQFNLTINRNINRLLHHLLRKLHIFNNKQCNLILLYLSLYSLKFLKHHINIISNHKYNKHKYKQQFNNKNLYYYNLNINKVQCNNKLCQIHFLNHNNSNKYLYHKKFNNNHNLTFLHFLLLQQNLLRLLF